MPHSSWSGEGLPEDTANRTAWFRTGQLGTYGRRTASSVFPTGCMRRKLSPLISFYQRGIRLPKSRPESSKQHFSKPDSTKSLFPLVESNSTCPSEALFLCWMTLMEGTSLRSDMVHSFCGYSLQEVSINLRFGIVSLQLAGNSDRRDCQV